MKTNKLLLALTLAAVWNSTTYGQPTITRQPTNQSVSLGATASFSVIATSTNPPLSFQWRFNVMEILGQTTNLLTLANIQTNNAGGYAVVVADMSGSVTSQVAMLTVDTTFTKITSDPVVTDTDSFWNGSWGDYNGDGYIDLFVGGGGDGRDNHLYRNNGNGTFTKITTGPVVTDGRISLQSHGSSWTDYDNDGFLDLFVTGSDVNLDRVDYNKLYHNNGDGTFTRITNGLIATELGDSHGCSWADYDRDGFVDLFVVRHAGKSRLYHNNGNGGFTQILLQDAGLYPESGNWADYDNDGYPDLFITNVNGPNFLYHNTGGGVFMKITTGAIVTEQTYSLGCAWGDYDNDGYLDLFVCNGFNGSQTSSLFRNNGAGGFVKITSGIVATDFTPDGFANSCAWVDYDNDGFLDLFVTQNSEVRSVKNFLYHNNGDGTFTKITAGSLVNDLGHSMGCPWGDINNDGFSDLFVSHGYGGPADSTNSLYLNNGNSNAWLTLKLVGTASNRSAIGAKVRVRTFYRGALRWQLREIAGGSGYAGFNDLRAAFGLGEATNADLVRIEWPSGIVQTMTNVTPNQLLTVVEHQTPGPATAPQVTSVSTASNGVVNLSVTGDAGLLYVLEASTNLLNWTRLAVRSNATGVVGFTDTEATSYAKRFYRVSVP